MIIESRANERVKEARRLLLRKERKESGLHLIEGDKLVREAISSGAKIVSCFVEDGFAFTPPEGAIHYTVTRAVLESLCESQTPQGVVAVVETPALTPPQTYPNGLVVVLDGVQDPGNVGAILRSADAFGATGLLLSPACADAYAPKTLRAAMGSTYHLPVWQGELLPELSSMRLQGFTALCGDLNGSETLPPSRVERRARHRQRGQRRIRRGHRRLRRISPPHARARGVAQRLRRGGSLTLRRLRGDAAIKITFITQKKE